MDSATLIKTRRGRAGLTQRELADRAGTSAAAICLYETGQRVPRVDTLSRILAATGHTLVLDSTPPSRLDPQASGKVLVQVLDLAEQLPFQRARDLDAIVFAQLAQ